MRIRYIVLLVLLGIAAPRAYATTHTVTTPGFSFSPAALTVNVGDTVVFAIDPAHNVVEVSQTTWNNNGNTSNGGFTLPFGGGTLVMGTLGTYYYVCAPHASMGMKATITVALTAVSTGTLTSSSFCAGAALTVPFNATGTFNAGNTFTAQLSNASGSFAAPVAIGTLNGTTSGQISATIPPGTAAGAAYRIRVVSSNPALVGLDNGLDLTVSTVPTATLSAGGSASICDGQSVTLNANTGTGLIYTWRRNGTVIPGALGASLQATLAGAYTVEVSNGQCSATSTSVNVIVYSTNPSSFIWTAGQSTDWSTVGNWDSPCAVPAAGDTVIIAGSITPPTAIPAVSLARLVINNAAGVTLGGTVEITGSLTLTLGNIVLAGNHLEIAAGAAIIGGSASSFVVTSSTGELRQAGIGSGARSGAILFPVGAQAGAYTPLTVTNLGTADQIGVRVGDGVRSEGASGSVLVTDVVGKTWFITEGTAGGSNTTLVFQWNAGDEQTSFDRTACFVAHHDGSDWTPLHSFGAASGPGPYQRTATGVTSFSPFAIGDIASPLPVELRLFSADLHDGVVHLRWETEHERGVAGFAIERRGVDDVDVTRLGFMPSTAPEGRSATYQFTDPAPAGGSFLYRLRMIDLDGREELSPEVLVDVASSIQAARPEIVSLSPQPLQAGTASTVELRYTMPQAGTVDIALHDALGRRVAFLSSLSASSGMNVARVDASALPPGMYLVRVTQGTLAAQRRLVVLR